MGVTPPRMRRLPFSAPLKALKSEMFAARPAGVAAAIERPQQPHRHAIADKTLGCLHMVQATTKPTNTNLILKQKAEHESRKPKLTSSQVQQLHVGSCAHRKGSAECEGLQCGEERALLSRAARVSSSGPAATCINTQQNDAQHAWCHVSIPAHTTQFQFQRGTVCCTDCRCGCMHPTRVLTFNINSDRTTTSSV